MLKQAITLEELAEALKQFEGKTVHNAASTALVVFRAVTARDGYTESVHVEVTEIQVTEKK